VGRSLQPDGPRQRLGATGLETTTPPAADRQINQNAVFPPLNTRTTPPTKLAQKGVRIIECVDASAPTPLGIAAIGSPEGRDNSIVYSHRIQNFVAGLLASAPGLAPAYSTFQNGAWSAPGPISDANSLIGKVIAFYLAMEVGHSIKLTPTVEGTSQTSYGYHHAPGTGSNLDQTITTRTDGTNVIFYVPTFYASYDQANFRLAP
jgi:hypothetical protein